MSDRAAAEEPEVWSAADEVRYSIENGEWISHQEAQAVLAELDRQRALITAVLAECERVERDPGKFNVMATFEIRDLLGGEKKS